MAIANYRNYSFNIEDYIVIRLDSNFETNITSTNSMRTDEYANYLISQINELIPNRDIEISEDKVITIRLGLLFHKPAIGIRFYDINDYNNSKPNYTKEITSGLLTKIEKTVDQYIDEINNAKFMLVKLEENDCIKIFDNKLYGFFYDLNTNKYVTPPKIELHRFKINGIKDSIKDRIETFLR